MKTPVKNTRNKRAEKKQTNIKWNSRLFFQIGVILSLLIVFFIMQANFEIKSYQAVTTESNGLQEPPMVEYVIDIEKPKQIEPKRGPSQQREPIKRVVKSTTFEVKPNTDPTIETSIPSSETSAIDAPIQPAVVVPEQETNKPRLLANVEFVPIFPGCENEGSNSEKIACMSSKINSFIQKNFRQQVLEDLKTNEAHRLYVNFKIDANGYVTDVVATSRDVNLKKEGQRVINMLPPMKPGRQGNKNVEVLYTVPIVFNIK
ncbi:MAG: hypothetical protein COA40_05615 [Aequorivita sp.]|nr:MAG: hypothetical protein COA40_05615 [Aequorivita sp.]